MNHAEMYAQKDEREIERLLASQPTCLLVTAGEKDHETLTGVFNPHHARGAFHLHLNRHDEQVLAMRRTGGASLVFQDILTIIPSYWVDAHYGGAATTYYRYARFHCVARLIEEPEEIVRVLQGMMDRFQPEKGYDPLDASAERYRKSVSMLAIAELTVMKVETKWKIGQNRPEAVRLEVARQLRERAKGSDVRAADEIERWLSLHATPATTPSPAVSR